MMMWEDNKEIMKCILNNVTIYSLSNKTPEKNKFDCEN